MKDNPIDFDDSVYDDTVSGVSMWRGCNKKFMPTAHDLSYDKQVDNGDIWFVKRDFIPLFFRGLSNTIEHLSDGFPTINVVTQHSDFELDENIIRSKPKCVNKIFGPNNTCVSNDSVPVPLGLGPPFGRGAPLAEDIKKKDTRAKRSKLLYVNFRPNTFPNERGPLFQRFSEPMSWVTIGNQSSNYDLFDDYLVSMIQHKFCLCPRGNGIDTHRLWESLYSRTVPIVRYENAYRDFKDLPILFVDDWSVITEQYLTQKYDEMCGMEWDFSKLKASWWWKQFRL